MHFNGFRNTSVNVYLILYCSYMDAMTVILGEKVSKLLDLHFFVSKLCILLLFFDIWPRVLILFLIDPTRKNIMPNLF